MPDIQTHMHVSIHDEKFGRSLTSERSDWAVTSMFYAALHYVQAFLHAWHIDVNFHYKRYQAMRMIRATREIQEDYEQLKWFSERARYQGERFTKRQIDEEVIPLLDNIRHHLSPHLHRAAG